MRIYKIIAYYCIIVGISMVCMWSLLLATDQVPEIGTKNISIAFHLFSEFATSILLIISGFGIIKKTKWSDKLFLVAIGALIYSMLNAVGLYGQLGEIPMFVMFLIFLVLAFVFTVIYLRKRDVR